jgi:UDP-glucose 4-epimerase
MTVLVTGGLGYIGSHVVRVLESRGEHAVIIDDFSTGLPSRARDTPVVRVDLSEPESVAVVSEVIAEYDVSSVIHLAARKKVDESVERPLWYYSQNLNSIINVLSAMSATTVQRLVFSSSAAVYGSPTTSIVAESAPLAPINPYGETKLFGERIAEAASVATGIRVVSLRYFNVAGAGWDDLVDIGAHNLLPATIERIRAGLQPVIFGSDYPTPDGTCVRDYIHVLDLAEAHVAAIDHLSRPEAPNLALNVGTGRGTSVLELVTAVCAAMGTGLTPEWSARRNGDPASVVASVELIRNALSWEARLDLVDMVRSTLDVRETDLHSRD